MKSRPKSSRPPTLSAHNVKNIERQGATAGCFFKSIKSGRPASAKEWFESNNHKRNEEAWKQEDLLLTVNDMKKREWQAKFYTSLAEGKGDKTTLDWKEKQERDKKLAERRRKLQKLLKEDEEAYEKEREERRKNLSQKSLPQNLTRPEIELLKVRLEDLKRQNEEERKKLADKLSYESWRKNNPAVRQMESERFDKFVRDAWMDQSAWKEEERKKEEERIRSSEEEEEQIRRRAEEQEMKRQEKRRDEREKWRKELQEQMEELRKREAEEEELVKMEAALEAERGRLEDLALQRERLKEQRKRKDLELFWARQYQLKLKKKSADIHSELTEDENILEDLIRPRGPGGQICLEDGEGEWLMNVLEEQKRLEKLREKEYDLLFSEEAARMWNKREAEWRREQQARDRLMEDVLRGLQEQIAHKLTAAKLESDSRKNEKANLITSITDTQKKLEDRGRYEEDGGPKESTVKESRSVPSSLSETMRATQIADHQREVARLEEEMKKLWMSSYVPPRFGRKRVNWV